MKRTFWCPWHAVKDAREGLHEPVVQGALGRSVGDGNRLGLPRREFADVPASGTINQRGEGVEFFQGMNGPHAALVLVSTLLKYLSETSHKR